MVAPTDTMAPKNFGLEGEKSTIENEVDVQFCLNTHFVAIRSESEVYDESIPEPFC